MRIYPAIDLRGGNVVRLVQGDFNRQTTYYLDPLELALKYVNEGTAYLHVIDLDGAKAGKVQQYEIIRRIIAETGCRVQVGGGIRSVNEAEKIASFGADKIILGSVAVKDPAETRRMIKSVGAERITMGMDVQVVNGTAYVTFSGWRETSPLTPSDLFALYEDCGVSFALCTDKAKDGMLSNPNFDLYGELVRLLPNVSILASGGVGSLEDIDLLRGIGVGGVVIGKAFLEGRISFREALERC